MVRQNFREKGANRCSDSNYTAQRRCVVMLQWRVVDGTGIRLCVRVRRGVAAELLGLGASPAARETAAPSTDATRDFRGPAAIRSGCFDQ